MTSKEKAIDLFRDMKYHIPYVHDPTEPSEDKIAKECALIAVELHLEELSKMKLIFSDRELHYKYWQEVKQEIEKL
jgi:hypothetical protein